MDIFNQKPDVGYNSYGIWKGGLSPMVFDPTSAKGLIPNQVNESINPISINDGQLTSYVQQVLGVVYAGKLSFTDTTAGYRLGFDTVDNIVKFYIGNSTNYLKWDGSILTITGTETITLGAIAGLTISATSLTATAGGNTTTISSGATAFSAGPTGSPTVTITQAGVLTATGAIITGNITATTGAIGGFTIGATTVSATNLTLTSGAANTANIAVGTGSNLAGLNSANAGTDIAIWSGSTFANRATAPFRVNAQGDVTATSVTITGTVNATAGYVGSASTAMGIEAGGFNVGTTGHVRGNQTDYFTGTGFFLGYSGAAYKFSIGDTTANYLTWDGTTLTIKGAITVSKIDIPDTTTANSFHTDSSGNSWWGANVASGLANANASVTSAGAAVFKSIQVGGTTTQYTINNNGYLTFGDGSDGAGVADGATALAGATLAANVYTLTRDVYYTNLTVSTGVTIKPSGYRIFGSGTLTLNGTALITGNGNNGGNGGNGGDGSNGVGGTAGSAGTGAASLPDGYLKGSANGPVGTTGGAGQPNSSGNPGGGGGAGTATSNSIGSTSGAGGNGGNGGTAGANPGGTGGTGGGTQTATASNVKLIANWHLLTLLDIGSTGSTVKFDNSATGGSGGGGGGGSGSGVTSGGGGGGGSGGAGSAGRILAIYFRTITIGASASITANGGTGGNGGNGGTSTAPANSGGGGGGGGGAGGNGGQVILVYNVLTNNGTISANAGTVGALGTGGLGVNGGANGANGIAGTSAAGNVRQFNISL